MRSGVCRSLAGQRFTSRDDKPYCAVSQGALQLHCTATHCNEPHCTAPHHTAPQYTASHRTAPHCTLHCTALHRTALHLHFCQDCFGELFSKRCTACSKPITGESRTPRNETSMAVEILRSRHIDNPHHETAVSHCLSSMLLSLLCMALSLIVLQV